MAQLSIPTPPQLSGCFARLGSHDAYPWTPLPWKGVCNKVLFFDRCTGATIELVRIDKGAQFPEHYHTTMQTLFLVSGRLRTGKGDVIEPGTFNVIPAGQLHGPFIADKESVQFKYFSSVPVYILRTGETYIYRQDGTVVDAGVLAFAKQIQSDNFISG